MIKQHIRIRLASPERILKWTERINRKGQLIGEIKNTMIIKNVFITYETYNNKNIISRIKTNFPQNKDKFLLKYLIN